MFVVLLFMGTASAASIDCGELQQMVAVGLKSDAIIGTIANLDIDESERACIESADLDPALRKAALARLVDSTAPAGETPASPPPPVPVITFQTVGRPDLSCTDAHLRATMPSPGAAAVLSLGVGFGAGHYYANNNLAGGLFTVSQLGGLGVSYLAAKNGSPAEVTTAGMVLALLSRTIEVAAAPSSAQREALRQLERCGL